MNEELKAAIKRSNGVKTKPVVISEERLEEMLIEQEANTADSFIYA